MTQQMYSIREAAQALGLETHVLRYWEEELEIAIGRNPQGRRIYTEENLEVFKRIISCKEQGLQLKAIKELMDKEKTAAAQERSTPRIILYRPKEECGELAMREDYGELKDLKQDADKVEKARRLQELLKQFVKESVQESNAELLESVKEGLLKELDYQFRLQEEREEERERLRSEKEDAHFRELDENLRCAVERSGKRKRGLFAKKY